jgi:hypothetical protein
MRSGRRGRMPISFNDGRYNAKYSVYLKKFQSRIDISCSPSSTFNLEALMKRPGIKVSRTIARKKRITKKSENKKM